MKQPDLKREFSEENYESLVDYLNTAFMELDLGNFGGQVIGNVLIPAGSEIKVSHNLKSTPKYRIILKQTAQDSLVTDGDELWTGTYITLKNHGASDTTITLIILRG